MKRFNDAKLQSEVRILEYRIDVNQLMQAMDCFAFPSRFEGLPIVMIEAQAAGCDCLVSYAVTEETIITDHIERLPMDEKTWSDAILTLARGKNLRHYEDAIKVIDTGYDKKNK